MSKLILIIISLFCASLETYFIPLDLFYKIILFILFAIINIILEVGLFLLFFIIIEIPVNKNKEILHYNQFYRNMLYFGTKACLSLFGMKINVDGLEKIPNDSNFVIVFNHKSNLDSMVIDVCLHKYKLVFIAKKSLFNIPIVGKLIHPIGYIKLDRDNKRQEVLAISKAINFLKNDECSIGVAPEGTRNFTSDVLLPFKAGCFHLITESKKPLIITTITGTEEVKKNLFFKRHYINFKILKVLNYEDYKNLNCIEISNKVKSVMLSNLMNNVDTLNNANESSKESVEV